MKTYSRILISGIVFNLGRFLFLITGGHHYLSRGWIFLGCILCFLALPVYLLYLKTRLVPMVTGALIKSQAEHIDQFSEQLTQYAISLNSSLTTTRDQVPKQLRWMLKTVIERLLGVNLDTIFDHLESDQPLAQQQELHHRIHTAIQEKADTGPGGRSVVIVNIIIHVIVFTIGYVMTQGYFG